jgi:ABC-type nitrate/sulfonate/bicarbonate transport system ATPase subunit
MRQVEAGPVSQAPKGEDYESRASMDNASLNGQRGKKIHIEGLGVTFRSPRDRTSFEALRDIDLSIADGEFVSILGRSGCGKSTFFNTVAGLVEPTTGTVRCDGNVVNGRPGKAGYMMQRDHLFPWRTVRDNVVVGLDVLGENKRASRERADQLFPLFGLEGFQDAYPAALSGGMRQRAALMRTMLLDRPLLLLDEPFGALDAITRAEMQTWLLGIWEKFRRTVLFITHDVEEAVFLSDRVILMGGPPGQILTSMDVPIHRPRKYADVVTNDQFIQIKHGILDVISR